MNNKISRWIFGNKFKKIFTHRDFPLFSLLRKIGNYSRSSKLSSSITHGYQKTQSELRIISKDKALEMLPMTHEITSHTEIILDVTNIPKVIIICKS